MRRTGQVAEGPPPGEVARPGRIRALAPFAVLVVPAGLALLATAIIGLWPCEGTGCGEPHLGAWVLVLFAVPTALAVGLPWIVSPINIGLALATSLAGWVAFGVWAGRRATEDVDATWGTYWREVAFYAAGVVLGVLGGGLAMVVVITLV